MEPLGAAASALAVTDLAIKITEYWIDVSNAQADIEHLCNEVKRLSTVAKRLCQLLEEPRGAKLYTTRELEAAVKDGKSRFEKLEKKLTGRRNKVAHRYGIHAMLWPFKSKYVKAEAQELVQCRGTIEAALQVDMAGTVLDVDLKTTLSKLPTVHEAAFDSHAEEHNPTCYPNTRVELLEKINLWVRDPAAKAIFWLNGMAGTGKSTISRTLARSALANGCLGASFFFKKGEGDRGGASKFLTTIVAQLVSREPMIVSHVQSAIDADPSIVGKSMAAQFERLLIEPLSKAAEKIAKDRTLLIVVDALDECDHDDDIQCLLRLFSRVKDLQHPKLRFFLTSRPEFPIRLGLTDPDVQDTYEGLILHEMPRAIIEQDLNVFIAAQMEQIRKKYNRSVAQLEDRDELPPGWPDEEQIRRLVEMAAPLFISAATFCRFIANGKGGSPSERLQKVLKYQRSNNESKLTATYLPVLTQQTADLSPQDQEVVLKDFHHIVGSIVVLANPLSASALARLLNTNTEEVWGRLDQLHSVLNVPSRAEAPIKLLHGSFRDFLLDETTSSNSFSINEMNTHEFLAKDCLRTMQTALRMNICQLQAPEALFADVNPERISDALRPEVQYACSYWVYHLAHSGTNLSDNDEVHKFLTSHFLHWLEALSWMGRAWVSLGDLDTLRDMVDTDAGRDLIPFLEDARRFVSAMIRGVEIAPLQVYSSGLLFAPKRSVIRTTFESQIPKWICFHPKVEDDWNSGMRTLDDHSSTVRSVVFSPDGTIVASASRDRTIRLWNAETGEHIRTLKGHKDSVGAVTFSPDNSTMASASDDKTVRLWNAKTGECIRTLEGHSGLIWSVTFSADSQFIASASADNTIRLWNIQTGKPEHTLKGHGDFVFSVAFSPNKGSNTLASASADRTIRLWDLQTGALKKTIEGHSDYVWSVAFFPNRDIVASASSDGTIRFWDVNTGINTQTLEGHSSGVRLVTFSPNGAILASASVDETVRLWNTESCTCDQTLGLGTQLQRMSFNKTGSLLLTDVATIAIAGNTQLASTSLAAEDTSSTHPASPTQLGHRSGYGISQDRCWITQGDRKILWLPAHIRPGESAIHGSVIAIGNASGRMTILRFKQGTLVND